MTVVGESSEDLRPGVHSAEKKSGQPDSRLVAVRLVLSVGTVAVSLVAAVAIVVSYLGDLPLSVCLATVAGTAVAAAAVAVLSTRRLGPNRRPDESTDQENVSTMPHDAESMASPRARRRNLLSSSHGSVVAYAGTVGSVATYVASVIGQSHSHDGTIREDAYALGEPDADIGVVAVSDGVGSTRNSHAAALLVAETAVEIAMSWSNRTNWSQVSWSALGRELIETISRALRTSPLEQISQLLPAGIAPAPSDGAKGAQPAATLAAAVYRREPSGGLRVLWANYGDSAILHLAGSHWHWQAGQPDRKNSATPALPGRPGPLTLGEFILGSGECLVLASDGFADAIASAPKELARAIYSAAADGVTAAQFATLLEFEVAGLFDDKTLLVIAP